MIENKTNINKKNNNFKQPLYNKNTYKNKKFNKHVIKKQKRKRRYKKLRIKIRNSKFCFISKNKLNILVKIIGKKKIYKKVKFLTKEIKNCYNLHYKTYTKKNLQHKISTQYESLKKKIKKDLLKNIVKKNIYNKRLTTFLKAKLKKGAYEMYNNNTLRKKFIFYRVIKGKKLYIPTLIYYCHKDERKKRLKLKKILRNRYLRRCLTRGFIYINKKKNDNNTIKYLKYYLNKKSKKTKKKNYFFTFEKSKI